MPNTNAYGVSYSTYIRMYGLSMLLRLRYDLQGYITIYSVCMCNLSITENFIIIALDNLISIFSTH